jgi:hypothetical protein
MCSVNIATQIISCGSDGCYIPSGANPADIYGIYEFHCERLMFLCQVHPAICFRVSKIEGNVKIISSMLDCDRYQHLETTNSIHFNVE